MNFQPILFWHHYFNAIKRKQSGQFSRQADKYSCIKIIVWDAYNWWCP